MGCHAIDTELNDKTPPEPARTQAAVRRSSWPGWIWAIPIAALLLVGWWAFRALTKGGEEITITFDNVHGLKQGSTSLLYRGLKIGKVTDVALSKEKDTVDVTVRVQESAVEFLKSGTRFWLRGATPSLSDLSTLGALLSGPSIVMEPGPGEKQTHFAGLAQEPVTPRSDEQPQLYRLPLNGRVGGLKQGEPVKLRAFTVGEVRDVGFRYNPTSGELATPVTIALYPSLFHIGEARAPDSKAALATAIDRLVQEGLRARLERDPPLVGNPQVSLDIVPGSSHATVAVADGIPQIPAEPGGGLNSIVDRVNKLPVEEIAQNVLDTTRQVESLVSSPKLGDAIAQLDTTLNQIHQTANAAGPQITKLVESLRRTAEQLRTAASAANNVLGGRPSQNDMQKTMSEINDAARSVRELADYLDRHPEALVRGRTEE